MQAAWCLLVFLDSQHEQLGVTSFVESTQLDLNEANAGKTTGWSACLPFGFVNRNCSKNAGTNNATLSLSKNSVFRRPHEYTTVSFPKKSTLESAFEKLRFWSSFSLYVWTITISITKCRDTCKTSLILQTYTFKLQFPSVLTTLMLLSLWELWTNAPEQPLLK